MIIRYSKEDLQADYRYSLAGDGDGFAQVADQKEKLGKEENIALKYDAYQNQILGLNTVIRIDSYCRTPFSIHMSYPSARSLYTIRSYMVSQEFFLTKDIWGNNIVVRPKKEVQDRIKVSEGDILIELLPFRDSHYPCIFKTLQNLEVGHLLYNIGILAKQYGREYWIDNDYPSWLILRQKKISEQRVGSKSYLETFWKKAMVRSSGKYYGGLINFDMDYKKYRYCPKKAAEMKAIRFHNDPRPYIDYLLFWNDGKKYVDEDYGLSCSYESLMQEYHYVNFRSQTQIFLILLKGQLPERENYAHLIQYMGMLAQEICIENSYKNVFNRPIKQIRQRFWKPILNQNPGLQGYIPFYGVITGKDSIGYSKSRQVI